MDLITYETIRAAHRAEKEEILQSLPKNFFEAVRNWLEHKQSQRDTSSLLEIENAKKLLEDIVNRRERKIMLAALRTIRGELPPANLTDKEREFFDRIVNELTEYRDKIKEETFGPTRTVEEKIEEVRKTVEEIKINSMIMVKILSDIPKFVGTDMQAYGPLKSGEVVNLPKEIANLLVTRKVAENLVE